MTRRFSPLAVALPALLAGGMAGAEVQPPGLPALPAATAADSPFAYAETGRKAAHLQETASSDEAGRVIGGTVAKEGAWPWQVALMIAGQPVGPDSQFCGGTMLLETWVLTAAHCIHMADDSGNYRDLPPQAIAVLVGTNQIVPGRGDLVPVTGIYRHPDYVGTEFDHDIALIRLARPPQAQYATIKVPDAQFGDYLDQPGVTTIVTGWGLIDGGTHPSEMRQAEIQMLSRDACNQSLLEARAAEAVKGFAYAANVFGMRQEDAQAAWGDFVARVPAPLSANMLCSGTYEGGKTACQGDSGGPLVVPLDDGSYVQAGVVSWGLSSATEQRCAEDALFSAYTRVSNFLPWLEQTISANP
jgi:secreted trypsin-like serine protease